MVGLGAVLGSSPYLCRRLYCAVHKPRFNWRIMLHRIKCENGIPPQSEKVGHAALTLDDGIAGKQPVAEVVAGNTLAMAQLLQADITRQTGTLSNHHAHQRLMNRAQVLYCHPKDHTFHAAECKGAHPLLVSFHELKLPSWNN